jgi:polyhydroxybutyrate depolymerase
MSRLPPLRPALRLLLVAAPPALAVAGGAVACGSSASVESANPLPGATSPASLEAGAPAPSLDASLDGAGIWPTQPSDAAVPDAGVLTFGDAAPVPSNIHCTGKTGPGGDTTLNLTSGGLARDALVHVPPSYDATTGTMLILNFHGYTSNAPEEEFLTDMNATADARNFITVYPDGVMSSFNAGACCGVAWNNSVDDIQFTKDLLANLESQYCIDPTHIFATGMSNGGFMAHRLGCQMADVFAAIAPVAGVMGIPDDQCQPSRPVPVLDFHGTADPVVPYNGGSPLVGLGSAIGVNFQSVAQTIDTWLAIDVCLTPGVTIFSSGDATCIDYTRCAQGGEVVQCTIANGGHTWPGGVPIPLGNTSTSISATNTMVDFFLAHPMP